MSAVFTGTPTPTPQQVKWQQMEVNAFVHFGPNTFTDKEWGGGDEDPRLFAPTQLDCDQWARVFKQAGFKGVIITAKHHDGFCLWPTKFSNHSVAESGWKGGKGDVLRDLSQACRKAGLKFGVYLSPWDRNHPAYGTDAYNQVFADMLREVLTQYGPVFEVWFDGANGEGPNGKKQVYDWPLFHRVVRECQPKAVIFSDGGPDVRWVGNEDGYAGETCWSMIPSGRFVPGTPHYSELTQGFENGDQWVPAECDVSIRPGWFYHPEQDTAVKSGRKLLELYEKSVGRNSLLLLNVPPDRRGQISAHDEAALLEFGRLRNSVYGVDLSSHGRWSRKADLYTFVSNQSVAVDRISLSEDIRYGQMVKGFKVETLALDGSWVEVAAGTTIGAKRIVSVPMGNVHGLRVRVTACKGKVRLNRPTLHCTVTP